VILICISLVLQLTQLFWFCIYTKFLLVKHWYRDYIFIELIVPCNRTYSLTIHLFGHTLYINNFCLIVFACLLDEFINFHMREYILVLQLHAWKLCLCHTVTTLLCITLLNIGWRLFEEENPKMDEVQRSCSMS